MQTIQIKEEGILWYKGSDTTSYNLHMLTYIIIGNLMISTDDYPILTKFRYDMVKIVDFFK